MGFISRKKIAAAAVIATVGVGGVVAYAYWTTGGAGTGSATAGSNFQHDLVVTNDAPTSADIVPGGSTTVTVHVANNNTGTAQLAGVTGVVSLASPAPSDCSAADFTIDPIVTDSSNDKIAPSGSNDYTTTLHFADQPTVNQNGCKTAALDIVWTVN